MELLAICLGDAPDKAFSIEVDPRAPISRLRTIVASSTRLLASDLNLFAVRPGAKLSIDDARITAFLASEGIVSPNGAVRLNPEAVETHLPVTWLRNPTTMVSACIGAERTTASGGGSGSNESLLRLLVALDGRVATGDVVDMGMGMAPPAYEPQGGSSGPSASSSSSQAPSAAMRQPTTFKAPLAAGLNNRPTLVHPPAAQMIKEQHIAPAFTGSLFTTSLDEKAALRMKDEAKSKATMVDLAASAPLPMASPLYPGTSDGPPSNPSIQLSTIQPPSVPSATGMLPGTLASNHTSGYYTMAPDGSMVPSQAGTMHHYPHHHQQPVPLKPMGQGPPMMPMVDGQMPPKEDEKKKKKFNPIAIAVIVVLVLAIVAGITAGLLLSRKSSGDNNTAPAVTTTAATTTTTKTGVNPTVAAASPVPTAAAGKTRITYPFKGDAAVAVNSFGKKTFFYSDGKAIQEMYYNGLTSDAAPMVPLNPAEKLLMLGDKLIAVRADQLVIFNVTDRVAVNTQGDSYLNGRNSLYSEVVDRLSTVSVSAGEGLFAFVYNTNASSAANPGQNQTSVVTSIEPVTNTYTIIARSLIESLGGLLWSVAVVNSTHVLVGTSQGKVHLLKHGDARATVWDRTATVDAHPEGIVRTMMYAPKAGVVYTAGSDGSVRCWDFAASFRSVSAANNARPFATFNYGGEVTVLAMREDETQFAVGGKRQSVNLYRAPSIGATADTNPVWTSALGYDIYNIFWAADPQAWLVTGNTDNQVLIAN
ncbi:hypothetical protein HDU96_001124 [Phlyctochytrium bullatum]|nr:hypothetical protein HDU96_001124 [Phlyctochytrium bullatum]